MAEGGSDKDRPTTPEEKRRKHPSESDEGDEEEEDEEEEEKACKEMSSMEKLRRFLNKTLGIKTKRQEVDEEVNLSSLEEITKDIKNDKYKNIIVMCGAGVSTSAGIPDFRSPGSGLYDNLQKYDLPDPQCIFDISYFESDPRPFYSLAKEFFPDVLKPTPSHYFMRFLHERSHLLRIYTQNIDTLEQIAGVPPEKIVEAHGTFRTSHCIKCKKEFSLEWMKEKIFKDEIPKCSECEGNIKPDIVFFGEGLPKRFFDLGDKDFKVCDLLIVMGTSLVVQPFASLVDKVPRTTVRLLINKEKVGQVDPLQRFLGAGTGMDFDSANNVRDVAWLGLCDNGCQTVANLLGWGDDLRNFVKKQHAKIDKQPKNAGHE